MQTIDQNYQQDYNGRARTPAEHEVRYFMRVPPVTINLASSLSDALTLMHEHDIRRLPVVLDTGELRGIITDGDIRGADIMRSAGFMPVDIAETLRQVQVYQVMTENPIAVSDSTSLREVATLMIENHIGGIPVVDDHRMVVGIITESDLFEVLVQRLDAEC